MALIPVDNVGQVGIVKDINPWQLPPNVWSDGNNVRAEHWTQAEIDAYAEVASGAGSLDSTLVNLTS
jgi:hypothetical protein